MFDLQKRLDALTAEFEATWQKLNIDQKLSDMQKIEEEVAVPEIWNNPDNAREKTTQLSNLHDELDPWQLLKTQIKDISDLMSLGDDSLAEEFAGQLDAMEEKHYVSLASMIIMTQFCALRLVRAVPRRWTGLVCLSACIFVGRSAIILKSRFSTALPGRKLGLRLA